MTTATEGLAQRTIVGAIWTSLAMGAQAILQVIALLLLARLLTPDQFGIFAAALVVTGFCSIFSELGVGPAIVQRPNLEDRHLRVGFTLSILLGLAVAALVWSAAPAVARFFRQSELVSVVQALSLAVLCQGVSTVAMSLAQRELRFRWLAATDAIAFAVGFVIVAPVLAWFGTGVWALVGAGLTQQTLRMIMLMRGQSHPKRPLLDLRIAGELLHFGAGFSLGRIGNLLAGQGDNLVVGRWLGAQMLGFYTHAHHLMTAPAVLVGQILDRVLFPTMAMVQLDHGRLARAYGSGIALCTVIMLPASLLLAMLAPEVVLVLLGPAWTGVEVPLRILALGMLFRTSYKLSDSVARATAAVYARAWRQAVFAAAILSGSIVGQVWGLGGVAAGVLAAIALNYLLMAQLSLRLTRMRWLDFARLHVPGIVLAAVICLSAWPFIDWLRTSGVAPSMILLEVAGLASLEAALLCTLLPDVFLGRSVRPVLRTVWTSISPSLQRRLQGQWT